MFDAGIISRPALSSNNGSPVSSDRMSTPQTPRAMIGAVKTSVRSARSRATAAEALGASGEEVGGVAPAGSEATGAVAQPAESEIATHAAVTVRIRVVVVGRCVVNVSVCSVLSVLSAAR